MTPKNDNYEHNLYYTQHKWLPHFFYGATAPLMKEIQGDYSARFVPVLVRNSQLHRYISSSPDFEPEPSYPAFVPVTSHLSKIKNWHMAYLKLYRYFNIFPIW